MKLKKVLSGFIAAAMVVTSVAISSVVAYAEDLVTNGMVAVSKLTDVTKAAVTVTITDAGTADNKWGKIYIYCKTNAEAALDMSKVGEAQTVEVAFDGSESWYQIGWMGSAGLELTFSKAEFKKANGDVVHTYDPATDAPPELTKVEAGKYTYTAEAKGDSKSEDAYNAVTPKAASVDLTELLPEGKTISDIRKIEISADVTGALGASASINILQEEDPGYAWKASNLTDGKMTIDCPMGVQQDKLKLEIGWINYDTSVTFEISLECEAEVTVEVTEVTVTPATLALKVGDAASALTAAVVPAEAAQDVVWASSDTKVATVSADGKVTAVASGTAEITATAKDTDPAIVGKCVVTVTNPATKIEIDKTATLLVDGTKTLTVTTTPADADALEYTWTSDTPAVATVANGVVTGKSAGTAKITVTAGTLKAECTVTVTDTAVPATAVALNKETLELEVEGTATLTATVTPEDSTDTVAWTTSNDKVATVANGKVTAVAEGTATITATAGDKSATCAVTVTKKTVPITGIDVTPNVQIKEGESFTLNAAVAPENTTDDKTLTFVSGDTTVATVDSTGKITGVKAGRATITITASNGKTAACVVTVTAEPAKPIEYETAKDVPVTDYVPKEAPAAGTKTELHVNSISTADAQNYSKYEVTVTVTLKDGTKKSKTQDVTDCYKSFSYNGNSNKVTAENGFFIIVKVKNIPDDATVEMSIKGVK